MRIQPIRTAAAIGLLVLAACAPAAIEATVTPTTAPPTRVASTGAATPTSTSVSLGRSGPPRQAETPTSTPAPRPTATPVAAEGQPRQGGVLRMNVKGDPPSWAENNVHWEETGAGGMLALSQLFRRGLAPGWTELRQCDTAVNPDLAKSWKWTDDKTLQVVLKEGVSFHNKPPTNGRSLTAQDVVFSWGTYDDPQQAYWQRLVSSVEAQDAQTVVFQLNSPSGAFIGEAFGGEAGVVIASAEGVKAAGWEKPETSWIGTGPFMFGKWLPGIKYTMERNPTYFAPGRPYLDGVELMIMPDISTQLAALRSRKLDVLYEVPWVSVQEMSKTDPQVQALSCPGIYGWTLFMPVDTAPWSDVRVRRALLMSIDREALIKNLYLGRATALAVLTPGMAYALEPKDFPPETKQYLEFRPDQARQLMAEAGYSPEKPAASPLYLGRYPSPYREQAEAIASMAGQVGFNISIKIMEQGSYIQYVSVKRQHDGLTITRASIPSPDYSFSLYNFHSQMGGSANRSRVNEPEMDRLIEDFASSLKEDERARLAREIQLRAVDQAYTFKLPQIDESWLAQPGVRNLFVKGLWRNRAVAMEGVWLAR